MRRLLNGIASKQRPEDGSIKVEKRGGFAALSTAVSQVNTGASLGTPGVPGTTLMATLGDELVQIGNSTPYVYAPSGPRYEQFPHLVMTETAFRTIVHADTKSLSRNDGAAIGMVACYGWSDGSNCFTEFVDLVTGTPIRTPMNFAGTRIKIVADGTRFWIFLDGGGTTVTVYAFGTDGVQQGSSAAATTLGDVGAIWDVMAMPGTGNGVVIAHNVGHAIADYVRLVFITWTGSITVGGAVFNQNIPATFCLGWLRNDFDPTRLYLATSVQFAYGPFGGDPVRNPGIYVARMTLAGAHDVIYPINTSFTQAQAQTVMGLTGYVASASRDIYVAFGQFERVVNSPGRPMNSTTTTWYSASPGSTALQGVKRSVSLAGRAFKLGTRYVIPTYYASTSLEAAASDQTPPVAQPTYFLVDAPTQDIVGEFEFGTASMDWAMSGWDPTANFGPGIGWLASPFADSTGIVHLPFGYAADLQLTQFLNVTSFNRLVPIVGLLDIQLGGRGTPVEFADELLLPGPRPVAFSRDVFTSAGFELGAEAPSTQAFNSGSAVMVLGETHRYQIIYSALDTQGNRLRSIASTTTAPRQIPPGGSDSIKLFIPMLRMTNFGTVLIEIYRDSWDSTTRVASSSLHKITVDQAVSGDARTPLYNDPTVDSITYVDTITNSVCAVGAVPYTDDGTLDFMAPPPFSTGAVLGDRVFVGGYDNRVYYSFSKVPGQAVAFNQDEMFITLPARQKVTAIVPQDNRLFMFCDTRIFYVDGGNFLSADGLSGENPTPIELQFKDGCTGRARASTKGIVYASSAGGAWLLTRGLEKVFIGKPVEDDTHGLTCLDIAVDTDQRIGFMFGLAGVAGAIVTYDPIHDVWSPWTTILQAVALCAWQGRFTFASTGTQTFKHDPTIYADLGSFPISTRIDLDDISLADINGFQVIWEGSINGEWKGAHTFNIDVSYDGSPGVSETFSQAFPASVDPFRADFQPKIIECSTIGLSIYDTFPIAASQGFTLESLGLYVGVERGQKYQERRLPPV